jgi:hypothetical protein
MERKRCDLDIAAPIIVALILLVALALFAFLVTAGIEPAHQTAIVDVSGG